MITYAFFMQLIIPKYHGVKLLDIPDDQLGEILVGSLLCPWPPNSVPPLRA